jgi:predicted MFS family arabinose efflux permease
MIWLGAVAFCNALGSVIIFPLAPFVADDLSVPVQDIALASLCFNGAAGLGGLASALFFGRLGSRRALLLTLIGLAVSTGLSSVAPNFAILLLTRLLAGLCAGPLLAVVFSQAAELAPRQARNRASGAIVGSYGLALMFGSPVALALVSAAGSWRAPFVVMTIMCLALAIRVVPTDRRGQVETGPVAAEPLKARNIALTLMRPGSVTGLLLTACASFGTLLISPHLSTFAVKNVGASPSELGSIYLIGGALALLITNSTGWVMDRLSPRIASVAVGAVLTVLLVYAFVSPVLLPFTIPVLGFVLAAQLGRSTIAQASATRVPRATERIAYQCLVSAVTSLAQAAGAGSSALLLSERSDGHLIGIEWPALISILICWLSLWLVVRLERQISATASFIDAPRT